MTDMLDVYSPISYDESVSQYEVHSYIPYNTTRFENNDKIRITNIKSSMYCLVKVLFISQANFVSKLMKIRLY